MMMEQGGMMETGAGMTPPTSPPPQGEVTQQTKPGQL
jgi:hypothetical protein